MSDYEYEEEYQYEEPQQEEEENVETKIELDYFEVEELIRKGDNTKAIQQLQTLYTLSEQNNLKNWKVKILNQLLTMSCKQKDENLISKELGRIIKLNQTEKYTENSIRSIISIIKQLEGKLYVQNKQVVLKFIEEMDPTVQLKCQLLFLEKAVDQKNLEEAQKMFEVAERLVNESESTPAGCLLELYSLEIKHSKNTGIDITDKIRSMQLKMPVLENEAYMSQGHISVLKEAIAENMYKNGNYENCALYLAEAFQQKAKYGNNARLKEILKINVLICLLIDEAAKHRDEKWNMLFNEISTPFKNQKDVQALFKLIDSFQGCKLSDFQEQYKLVSLQIDSTSYSDVFARIEYKLKKTKLQTIIQTYKRIKFSYIAKRLSLSESVVEKMIFELLTDEAVNGKIHLEDDKKKYLEMLPPRNEYLEIQLQNLRQLSKRYM